MSIVLEAELLTDQFILVGDDKVELLHHAVAGRLAHEIRLLIVHVIGEVVLNVILRLFRIDGARGVIFANELLLQITILFGGRSVCAAALRWVIVYIYKL